MKALRQRETVVFIAGSVLVQDFGLLRNYVTPFGILDKIISEDEEVWIS